MWSWQQENWPNFQWDRHKLVRAEQIFIEHTGIITGTMRHLLTAQQQTLSAELISAEALDTTAIEGEYLDRASVRSSIRRELGLGSDQYNTTPAEAGIAAMMVDLYQTLNQAISANDLCKWHQLLMNGRHDIEQFGAYRTHTEAMQIISGPDYARRIHFEAPPSKQVKKEMDIFFQWLADTAPSGTKAIPTITRAAIAHAWFETIHPFEDGNGRIGRAIAEKVLAQGFETPVLTLLAKTLLKRRKTYYGMLNKANRSLIITDWILWFATAVIEAQKMTLSYIDFIIEKTKLLDQTKNQLNPRQEKALFSVLKQGPEGFTGGLSAANYISITRATTATATRDLQDLVFKNILHRTGTKKATRYHLAINLLPVTKVTIDDIT